MEKKSVDKKGILLTLLGGICWGISGCFGQYLFQKKEANAQWLVSVRLLTAGILLLAIGYLVQGKKLNEILLVKEDRKKILIFSLFGMLFCQFFYFAAVEHTNAGTATVLQSLAPFVILSFVCVRKRRFPKKSEILGVLAAVGGVFFLSTHGNIHSMQLTGLGLFLGLMAAVGAAFYNLLVSDILRRYGVYPVVGFGMLFGGMILAVLVRPWRYSIIWDWQTVLCLFGVIVIGTTIAFCLYLKGVSMVGPFMASLLGTIEPVTAIIISFVFLGADFKWIDLVGFAMILGTVVLMSLGTSGIEMD